MTDYYTFGELTSASLLFKPVSDEEAYDLKYGRGLQSNPSYLYTCCNPISKPASIPVSRPIEKQVKRPVSKPVEKQDISSQKSSFYTDEKSVLQEKYGKTVDSHFLYPEETISIQSEEEWYYNMKYGRDGDSFLTYQKEEEEEFSI